MRRMTDSMLRKFATTTFIVGSLVGIAATAAMMPMIQDMHPKSMIHKGKRAIRRYVSNML